MSPQNIFIYVLLSAAETAVCYSFFSAYMRRKDTHILTIYISFLVYFTFQIFSYFNPSPLFSTVGFYILFAYLIALFCFEEQWQNKIALSCMLVVLNYGCKLLSVTLFMYFQHMALPHQPYALVLNASMQISACTIFMFFVWFTIRLKKLRLQNRMFIYTISPYISPYTILFVSIVIFRHSEENILAMYLDVAFLLFATAMELFYIIDKNMVLDETEERSSMMTELLFLQRKYYAHLDFSLREVNVLRHDMKKHMNCIMGLVEHQKYDEVQNYINAVYGSSPCLNYSVYSGNIIIDSIINHTLECISSGELDVKTSLIVPPHISIEDVDLSVLYGNLVENAIEACRRIKNENIKKFIDIRSSVKNGFLFIRVSNSFDGVVNIRNNKYCTVKLNERVCGIGLSNISSIVEKYEGEMSIEHSDNCFTVSVMLAVQPVPEPVAVSPNKQ